MLQRLTAPRFLAYLLALLVALNLSVEFANLNGRRGLFLADGNLPVGRDFAVFFAAGDIVAEGDGAALYSLDRQQQELSRLLERDEFFLPFAYPAFVALPYALLSRLPYLWAYALGTAVMFGAFVAAVHMLRQGSLSARDHTGFLLLGLFAYSPVTWATFGGLNGAFSLLCLAGAYASLVRGRAGSAGLWLGCLLFKPQLAGPLLLLLLWRRQWRTVATAVVVGLVLSVAGALATKPTWPVDLAVLTSSDRYLDPERECCGRLHSSLVGVVSWWLGGNDWPTILISTAVGAVTVALTIYAWRDARPSRQSFPLQLGFGIAVTLFFSPHSLFYESVLLVIPLLVLIDYWRGRDGVQATPPTPLSVRRRSTLIGLFLIGSLWPIAMRTGIQPAAILPIAVGGLCLRTIHLNRRLISQTNRGPGRCAPETIVANARPAVDASWSS